MPPTGDLGIGVSATDGSADSQAIDLSERTWKPHKTLAWTIRFVAFISPIIASVLAARIFSHIIHKPPGLVETVAWVTALMGVALLAMRVTEIAARRLLPITAMLKMSLVFPDEAPNQFSIALRSASGKQLQAAVELRNAEQSLGTPQEAAENLVVLLAALRTHDPATRGHCERVRAYSDVIAKQMELPPEDAAKLHWGALVHDLGKLEIPADLLNKKSRLTSDEWKIMRGHPGAAEKWIEGLSEWLGPWALAATQHHERWDGNGYPLGLKGEEISLSGRIVAVADAFDVMTAARPYKDPLPHEQARAELAKGAGNQFDPRVVRAMLDASIPKMRWRVGPLATIANLPTVLSAPITASVGAAGTAATTVGAAAVITATALAPAPIPVGAPPLAFPTTTDSAESVPPESEASDPVEVRNNTAFRPSGDDADLATTEDPPSRPDPVPPSKPLSNGTTTTMFPPPPTSVPPTSAPSTTGSTTTVPTTSVTTTTAAAQTAGHGPYAREDVYLVEPDSRNLVLDVLANDEDADGDIVASSLKIVIGSITGNRAWVSNGEIHFKARYEPASAFRLDDALVYSVCDATDLCTTATVKVKFPLPSLDSGG